jgi:hypothetical protein
MKKLLLCLLLFTAFLYLGSCGLLYSAAYTHAENRAETCTLKINQKRISGRCYRNNIRFEQLEVIRLEHGIPVDYYITKRFSYRTIAQLKPPKSVSFHRSNAAWRWKTDSVHLHVQLNEYKYPVLLDTLEIKHLNNALPGEEYQYCPVKFSSDTWYHIYSLTDRHTARYVFVDKRMKFHVHAY